METVLKNSINNAVEYLNAQRITEAEIGIILGSGLNDFVDEIADSITVPYNEIPGFYGTTVDSHRGELVYGTFAGKKVIVLAGRFHYYEGYSMQEVSLPTRVLIKLGIKRLVISNASGVINRDWNECEFMLIKDHINMSGHNPLIGENLDEFGPRFPDMTNTYDKVLREKMKAAASQQGLTLREGVYAMMPGPMFETPAEIKMLGTVGADAVGMSSVPEAIVANHAGIEIIGLSFMSNWAAGLAAKVDDQEIFENGLRYKDDFAKFVKLACEI